MKSSDLIIINSRVIPIESKILLSSRKFCLMGREGGSIRMVFAAQASGGLRLIPGTHKARHGSTHLYFHEEVETVRFPLGARQEN